MASIIKAENLVFSYPGDESASPVRALDGVSFEIEEGSFTAILGHNGSGKSTLAKLLCMINLPDSGKLTILGKDMTAENTSEADILTARREIGMVFQNPDNQIVATIVEEDVAFGCENLGLDPKEIRKRVDAALESMGMTKYARHPSYNLSGGQKQRIAIAGAVAMNRKCIVFDESTAMLDPMGRREVMKIIKKLNREDGITVILITHYMNEVAIADKVVVVHEGKIAFSGTPSEVFSNEEMLSECSLESPQSAMLVSKLSEFIPEDAPCAINTDIAVHLIEEALIKHGINPKKGGRDNA